MVQKGKVLCFPQKGDRHAFRVKLEDIISRDPAMVGRSTLVLNATSQKWPGVPLVVKISWPTSGRVSETEFLWVANAMAEGENAWAADHLPRVYYAEDVVSDASSTLGSIASLFDNAEFVNGNYVYERRTLRIIIQERLEPLKSLGNVKEMGQFFLDVACGTCISFRSSTVIHSPRFIQFIIGSMCVPASAIVTSVPTTSCAASPRR